MHLKYYGTAAAEGIPAMFCTCEVCRQSMQLGGRNLRTRSQAMVDNTLLIDFPPDSYDHMLRHGLDLPNVRTLLVTHAHQDHLYPEDLEYRNPGLAHVGTAGQRHTQPLRIYGTKLCMDFIRRADRHNLQAGGIIELHDIEPFVPFQVDDFTVTALTANHGQDFGPVIYIITRAGKTMLYGNDTGYFTDEAWEYLAKEKPYFHFASLDCTGASHAKYRNGHMCLDVNVEVRERLKELGCADAATIFCSHHFSHNGGSTYDDFVKDAAQVDFLTSYDGMEIDF